MKKDIYSLRSQYRSYRKITITSTEEDTYSSETIDTLATIVNTIRVK